MIKRATRMKIERIQKTNLIRVKGTLGLLSEKMKFQMEAPEETWRSLVDRSTTQGKKTFNFRKIPS